MRFVYSDCPLGTETSSSSKPFSQSHILVCKVISNNFGLTFSKQFLLDAKLSIDTIEGLFCFQVDNELYCILYLCFIISLLNLGFIETETENMKQ